MRTNLDSCGKAIFSTYLRLPNERTRLRANS